MICGCEGGVGSGMLGRGRSESPSEEELLRTGVVPSIASALSNVSCNGSCSCELAVVGAGLGASRSVPLTPGVTE